MSPGDTFLSGIIANISVSVGGISVSLTVSIFDELFIWLRVYNSADVIVLGTPWVYWGILLNPVSVQTAFPDASLILSNKFVSDIFLERGPPNLDCVFSTDIRPLFNELEL